MSRVVIVKWDRLWADMIRRLVAEIFTHSEIIVCPTAAEALCILRANHAQFGVFGLTLPDMDGLDLLATVLEERTVSRILVVSGRRDERARQLLGRMRLDGYVDSTTSDEMVFNDALRKLRDRGTLWVTLPFPAAGNCLAVPQLSRILSSAELQVFAVIGDGTDDTEAAERLRLSAKTVHCHRQHIMAKLGVRTRVELMRVAIQRGIVRITSDAVIRPGFERELAERETRSRSNGDGFTA